jgi:pyruvate/2-oxoacid:ferredoxin oxidoreductase alpha subunit
MTAPKAVSSRGAWETMKRLLTGNEAAALAVQFARAQVIAAYPITPQTRIAEKLAEAVATGELRARYMKVESETSAMAACIGASMAGARAFTATSSQGLALMHELLHWASGARLPIVLVNVNRSMAAPWSLGVDQNDSLSQRDTGWIQLYCGSGQEVFDSVLLAFRLAEETLLPVMVSMEGFFVSHYLEPVEIPTQEEVDRFLPCCRGRPRLDPKRPCTFGGGVQSQVLYSLRKRMEADMEEVGASFTRLALRYAQVFGRSYRAVEAFQTEGSDLVLLCSGSIAGTVKAFLTENQGKRRVGLVQMRLFRPFPREELRRVLQGLRRVAVVDRSLSPGGGGIFAQEVKSALFGLKEAPMVVSVVGGLGGVDITPGHIDGLVKALLKNQHAPTGIFWMEG